MSPDRHPAPGLDGDLGPVPVLLLPEALEKDTLLLGIATAVNGLRDLLLGKHARFADAARQWHAKDDVLRESFCGG